MMWETVMVWVTDNGVRIGGNRNMVPTDGPLQQAFVRFCVDPINPRHNITASVFFDWSCNNDTIYYAVKIGKNWGEGGDRDIYKPVNKMFISLYYSSSTYLFLEEESYLI